MGLGHLRDRLRSFAHERDWEQFHHPKNLAMALAAGSGEVLELFQWLTDVQSRTAHLDAELVARARDEIADVLIYLIRIADVLEIDLEAAAAAKIDRNEVRYPLETSRGNALKHP